MNIKTRNSELVMPIVLKVIPVGQVFSSKNIHTRGRSYYLKTTNGILDLERNHHTVPPCNQEVRDYLPLDHELSLCLPNSTPTNPEP